MKRDITVTVSIIILWILLYFTYIYYGFKGVDWGFHWDEGKLFGGMVNANKTGTLLPGWYNYPSVTFWITTIASWLNGCFPNVEHVGKSWTVWVPPNHFWVVHSPKYQELINNIRPIFIILSSLVSVTTYISCRQLKLNLKISLICSMLSLGSFQIFYHSRWITPDPILMIFGAITTTLFIWGYKCPSTNKLVILALSAGLTLSAKYPGGLFIIYPLIMANIKGFSWKNNLLVLLIFLFSFIILTPGSILDYGQFINDIKYEVSHYKEMGHGIWTINPDLEHLGRILDFLAFRGISGYETISLTLFIFFLLGFYLAYKNNRNLPLGIISVPLIYTLYFSTQRVMFSRNLLVLLPFLFIFIAYTLSYLENIKNRTASNLAILLIACISATTTYTKIKDSTNSIFVTKTEETISINSYLLTNKNKTFLLSKNVQTKLGIPQPNLQPINLLKSKVEFYRLICELSELNLRTSAYTNKSAIGRYANKRHLYEVIAGANEIDLDYYPDWLGKRRYVIIKEPVASELAILNPSARWAISKN